MQTITGAREWTKQNEANKQANDKTRKGGNIS